MMRTHNINIGKSFSFLSISLTWMNTKKQLINSLPEFNRVHINVLSCLKKFFSSKEISIFDREFQEKKGFVSNILGSHSRYQEFKDLYNSGMMGAYKALSSYNKAKGKFSSYAYPFCKHEILEN